MKLVNKLMITMLALGMTVAFGQDDKNVASHNISITIPNVALLDIESGAASNDIDLAFDAPTEAGLGLADKSDNSLWLNVTSIILNGSTRNITVKAVSPVDGLDLKVGTTGCTTGFGSWGSSTAEFTLDGTDQTLVSNIKSGYTLNGPGNGYPLSYTVSPTASNDFGNLESGAKTVAVTYTLTL